MATRRELAASIGDRYRKGSRAEKRAILTEFVAVTGYHRKHAIRVLLGAGGDGSGPTPRVVRRLYDEAVRQALVILWEASDRVCGKRLKSLLPVLIEALERHGHLQLDSSVRTQVLTASAATIDRLLKPARAGMRKRAARRPGTALIRRRVPVRTFADWGDPPPGYFEGDLVAHCGTQAAGSFVHTLTLTDIATGWTECVPLVVRQAGLVVEGLEQLRAMMPFPLLGFDVDNGSEFMNETMIVYCETQGIHFTRARPYRKNDQAWVEQKNGAVVRKLVGYGRLEGLTAAEALSRLYAVARLFVNFFQPSFKLATKTRVGSRVVKSYHAPETPCSRLIGSTHIPEAVKDRLRVVQQTLDPLRLLGEIRALQHHVALLADGQSSHVPALNSDLKTLFDSLATAWKDGEVRPTHRVQSKPRRDWRTRKDPFEAVWPTIVAWLDAEPDRTAAELFERVQKEHPGMFSDGKLRTLQRRVREWRAAAARRLIVAPPGPVGLHSVSFAIDPPDHASSTVQ